MNILLAALLTVFLNTEPTGFQVTGNPVIVTATANETNIEHKFWVLAPNDMWRSVRDWHESNRYYWVPLIPGVYSVAVWTRRKGNTADAPEENGVVGMEFTIGAIPERLPVLLKTPPAGQCSLVQITGHAKVPSAVGDGLLKLGETAQYTPWGYPFPVEVPTGHYLGIKSMRYASKYIAAAGRSGYMVLYNIPTIAEHAPVWSSDIPLVLPPGFIVDGIFTNPSLEDQNMNGMVLGWLSADPEFRNCR